MSFMNKLERKYGKYAIKNLTLYIVCGNALVFLFSTLFNTENLISLLELNPNMVSSGQIWRLFSYIFIPGTFSPIWLFFELYIFYLIGTSLEKEWGSFKFNMYYLIGMIGTSLIAFVTKNSVTASYLNFSLFLAFAYIYPNFELLIFFILPVKVKYLAMLQFAMTVITILFGAVSSKIAAGISLVNFFLFFGHDIITNMRQKRSVINNRQNFRAKMPSKAEPMHKCTVCGITELDDPDMEFRYCSKCNGDYEYCMNHLNNHEHK